MLVAACVQGEDVQPETDDATGDTVASVQEPAVRGRCEDACDAGTKVVEIFCRVLPNNPPNRWRNACWITANESNAECKRHC